MKFLFRFILMFSIVFYLSCDQEQLQEKEVITPYSISGTIILPKAFDGESYIVVLDTDWDYGNGIVKQIEGDCSTEREISYTMNNVPVGGPYYLYASAPARISTQYITHDGYYGAEEGQKEGAILITVTEDSEEVLTGYNIELFSVGIQVIGRLRTQTEQTGNIYIPYIDNDTDPENGFVSCGGEYTFGAGLEHNFGIGGQIPGEYYFYAITDDLIGYYGSDDGSPEKAQKMTISIGDNTTHDIHMFAK